MLAKSGRLVALAVFTLLFSSHASAASQRAFVSSSGIDNPDCSLAASCRSFAAAIATIVSGGEVIVLDSAGYGPVTITKSASIIAPPGVYAGVSVFTGNGVTVNGAGISVVLRGLHINGLGGDAGIVIVDASRVRIEHCVVSKMSLMGIFHQASGARVTVTDTIVRDNSQEGIRFVTSGGAITLERVVSETNFASGIYISPNSASGYLNVAITDSTFAGNAVGIWADAGASSIVLASIDRSTVSENTFDGVRVSGSSSAQLRVTVQRSTLRQNENGIRTTGSAPSSIEVNAAENILHQNVVFGVKVDGSGAVAKASGNNYGNIVCTNGGTVLTYRNNSVSALTPGCSSTATLL